MLDKLKGLQAEKVVKLSQKPVMSNMAAGVLCGRFLKDGGEADDERAEHVGGEGAEGEKVQARRGEAVTVVVAERAAKGDCEPRHGVGLQ